MKHCSRCARRLPVEAFGANASRPDGLQHWCKGCRRTSEAPATPPAPPPPDPARQAKARRRERLAYWRAKKVT